MASSEDADRQLTARFAPALDARRLMATGTLGRATILFVRDRGATLGDKLLVEFELLVDVEDQDPYRVRHRQVVSRHVIARLRPGVSVPVRVDPCRPTSVLIG